MADAPVDRAEQNELFAEIAGRALCEPEFGEALLKDPDAILGQAGFHANWRKRLIEGLSSPNAESLTVADLFGADSKIAPRVRRFRSLHCWQARADRTRGRFVRQQPWRLAVDPRRQGKLGGSEHKDHDEC